MINKMFKQHKIKSRKKISRNHYNKIAIDSNNLSLTLSTSNVNGTACSTRNSKCMSSTISSVTSNTNYKSSMMIKQPQFITKAPKNAAIHFGNFYGLWNDVEVYNNNWNNHFIKEKTAMTERPHRLEFTRQMVHRLEKATNTEDYMRQVSVLLKKTVEPPNFRLNQLLSKNLSIPNGTQSSSDYPLWYKEPHKLSLVFSNPITQLKA